MVEEEGMAACSVRSVLLILESNLPALVSEPVRRDAGGMGGSAVFTWRTHIFGVEPRGFEPLTSAVQSQIDNCRDCSPPFKNSCKMALSHLAAFRVCSSMFMWVGVLLV